MIPPPANVLYKRNKDLWGFEVWSVYVDLGDGPELFIEFYGSRKDLNHTINKIIKRYVAQQREPEKTPRS